MGKGDCLIEELVKGRSDFELHRLLERCIQVCRALILANRHGAPKVGVFGGGKELITFTRQERQLCRQLVDGIRGN